LPQYSSRAVALALGIPPKELDNLISRVAVPSIPGGTQGRDRRIGLEAVLHLAVMREIRLFLGCSWKHASSLASQVRGNAAASNARQTVSLRVELERIREELPARLADASEYVVPRARGRPALRRSNRSVSDR
jgi:hypothetical protein